jgi:hypothetical protein
VCPTSGLSGSLLGGVAELTVSHNSPARLMGMRLP